MDIRSAVRLGLLRVRQTQDVSTETQALLEAALQAAKDEVGSDELLLFVVRAILEQLDQEVEGDAEEQRRDAALARRGLVIERWLL